MPRLDPTLPSAIHRLGGLAATQANVCTTGQALRAGLSQDAIDRLVRSGRWSRVHRGVYHLAAPKEISLHGRLWAAHLAIGPASVIGGCGTGHAVGLLDGGLRADEQVEVLVPETLRLSAVGVRVRRVPRPSDWAHPSRTPPMLTVEHTVLDLVRLAAGEAEAAEVVLRAFRLRVTTPSRILAAMATRARIRRRGLVRQLCAEARSGVMSELERRYRRNVARPHGLPTVLGQARAVGWAGAAAYRDLRYEPFGVIVELDGRLGHESESDQLRDQFRDNVATLTGDATLRYGWLAVVGQSCDVASQVGSLLQLRGWPGRLRPCGPGCSVLVGRGTAA